MKNNQDENIIKRGDFEVKSIHNFDYKVYLIYINQNGVEQYHKTVGHLLSVQELEKELERFIKSGGRKKHVKI